MRIAVSSKSRLLFPVNTVIIVINGGEVMRIAKVISISLPPDLNRAVSKIAKEERRSVSEIFREALRQYAANRVVFEVRKQIKRSLKRKLMPEDIERIVDEGRR